jgi:hypothetical protein
MDKRPQISDFTPKIQLDLDRSRIREIVDEALRMTEEYMGDYSRPKEDIFQDLNKIIDSGMISTMFFLRVGCSKIPDLQFRIDPRRRKILGISKFKKKAAQLNHLLRSLG